MASTSHSFRRGRAREAAPSVGDYVIHRWPLPLGTVPRSYWNAEHHRQPYSGRGFVTIFSNITIPLAGSIFSIINATPIFVLVQTPPITNSQALKTEEDFAYLI